MQRIHIFCLEKENILGIYGGKHWLNELKS
ncbi:hypothetical protein P799_01325 [Lysinibacillus sphaericus CBAM5]|uniref:Uncharacterized protein n=1 Tax=Lysinibacillus sphaericus CBAM5 TaxID=1400869 RepID=W7S615_LYSSH|nr:hypothetical protein P799_01325 [Lysinibacillus sphaericus CBAM5]